jgi:hypothetical protein
MNSANMNSAEIISIIAIVASFAVPFLGHIATQATLGWRVKELENKQSRQDRTLTRVDRTVVKIATRMGIDPDDASRDEDEP